jgi:hypothetical protein
MQNIDPVFFCQSWQPYLFPHMIPETLIGSQMISHYRDIWIIPLRGPDLFFAGKNHVFVFAIDLNQSLHEVIGGPLHARTLCHKKPAIDANPQEGPPICDAFDN